jgi:hypothetical protein
MPASWFRQKKSSILFLLLLLALISIGPVHAQVVAAIHVEPPASILEIGDTASVTILIEDASDVYGFQLRLTFNPAVIQLLDADDSRPGVQVQPGEFLPEEQGFIVVNEANNETGELNYAMTLLAPAEPALGNGSLIAFDMEAVAEGSSDVYINDVLLSSIDGVVLPTTVSHGQVFVGNGDPPPFGTPIPTSPPATPTAQATPTATGTGSTETPAPTSTTTATPQEEETITRPAGTRDGSPTSTAETAVTASITPGQGSGSESTRPAHVTPTESLPQQDRTQTATKVALAAAGTQIGQAPEQTQASSADQNIDITTAIAGLPESTPIGSEADVAQAETMGQDADITSVVVLLIGLVLAAGVLVIWLRRRIKVS